MSSKLLANNLQNPTLTLYAFHLRTDLPRGPTETIFNADLLWEQLVILGQLLQIPELQDLKQKLICYQGETYQPKLEDKKGIDYGSLLHGKAAELRFTVPTYDQICDYDGLLCAYRIHDTYAIDLTFSYLHKLPLSQIHYLNPQTDCLQASLGQTLVLFSQAPTTPKTHSKFADVCISHLYSGRILPELTSKGCLLNNPIFDYETETFTPGQPNHVLVWLQCQSIANRDMDQVTEHLLYILNCRHKILYAYRASRECDHKAKTLYSCLEEYIETFREVAQSPDHLFRFKEWLSHLPNDAFEYSRQLRNLSDHIITIKTNIQNYENQMKKLEKLPGNDLWFLRNFLDRSKHKFLKQIETDQAYLEPAQELFQDLLNTIRGLVEIEQAERDRALERKIQTAGVGLGIAAIVGSSSTFIERPWKPPATPNANIHPFVFSLLISTLSALIAGIITWWICRPKK